MKKYRVFALLAALIALWIVVRGAASQTPENPMYFPLVSYSHASPTPTLTPRPTRTPYPTPTPTLVPTQHPAYMYTTSYYMSTINPATLYDMGCVQGQKHLQEAGRQDGMVVLDFGMPKYQDGSYGASAFSIGFVTTAQLHAAVREFARGYWVCVGLDTLSHLTLGIGTSNYGQVWLRDGTNNYANAYNHGQAWAKLVAETAKWVEAQGYAGQVTVVGANDIELAWNTAAVTRRWVDGYASAWEGKYPYFDFGDCNSCPSRTYPGWNSEALGWSKSDIWYIAWGAAPAWPLPLVYSENGINAQQWAYLSLYSNNTYSAPLWFNGPMTQHQSCIQNPDYCEGLDNEPLDGWLQLLYELGKFTVTRQDILPWETDIKWWRP